MAVIQILFWILIGLLYLGIGFPYQEIVVGVCALVIGIDMLIGLLRR